MRRTNIWQSMTARLILAITLGGAVVLSGIFVFEYRDHNPDFLKHAAVFSVIVGLIVFFLIAYSYRRLINPLAQLTRLIQRNHSSQAFFRFAEQQRVEFYRLAVAIAQLLELVERKNDKLDSQGKTLSNQYLNAPCSIVTVRPDGIIQQANKKTAKLLGIKAYSGLVGEDCYRFILPSDRPVLREAIQRLYWLTSCCCEFRLYVKGKMIEVYVEARGDYDCNNHLTSVRMSLVDVSQARGLHRQLKNKTRLMNLVVDHMSDAIVLVDNQGKVAAVNQLMCNLLQQPESLLINRFYCPDTFWAEFGLCDFEQSIKQIKRIESDDRPAQESFETYTGIYRFQGIPVHDGIGKEQGRLWVITEVSGEEKNHRQLTEQHQRLASIKKLASVISNSRTLDELLNKTGQHLHEFFDVEAVGIAIRNTTVNQRTQQVIYQDKQALLLQSNRELLSAIESTLMPEILASPDFAYWPDLDLSKGFWPNDRNRSGWRQQFSSAGYTSLAVGPLVDQLGSPQGIIWIAHRSGKRFEHAEMLMLEMIAPVIEARLEIVQLKESLYKTQLSDYVTGLPQQEYFHMAAQYYHHATASDWTLINIQIDDYQDIVSDLSSSTLDQLLAELSGCIQSITRRSSFIARTDVCSFSIIIPKATSKEANQFAQRLCDRVALKSFLQGSPFELSLTVSLGIAHAGPDGSQIQDIIQKSRTRVAIARNRGGNLVVHRDRMPNSAAG